MADEEVVDTEVVGTAMPEAGAEPVVADAVVPDQDDGDPREGVDYEVVGENRYKWLETGAIIDGEGNEIEDTPEPVKPVAVVPEPTPAPVAQPSAVTRDGSPTPRTATETTQRPIYTREATKAAIFSDDAIQEIEDIRYTDPLKAARMQADLSERYSEQIRNLERHANDVFEQDLEKVAKQAPKAVEGLYRHIARIKDNMTPEQRQAPGAAEYAFRTAVANSLTGDMLAAEEIYVRATTHQRSAPAAPSRPAPKEVIPAAERSPGPGSAQRRVQRPRPASAATGGARLNSYATFQKQLHPDWSDEDCIAVAKSSIEAEENRRMPR